jgi:hypothetical protein
MAVHWCGSVNAEGLSAQGERIKYSRPGGTQSRATYILRQNFGCGERRAAHASAAGPHPPMDARPKSSSLAALAALR